MKPSIALALGKSKGEIEILSLIYGSKNQKYKRRMMYRFSSQWGENRKNVIKEGGSEKTIVAIY